ncbi:MAG: diguanylate cyclase [Deltaproteobacteria bacterium]|nr:diguanylate cyclase [Deltaproteobacteria bacterium]
MPLLVVDDSKFQRSALIAMLHDQGHQQVVGAASAGEALVVLQGSPQDFDLVLLDIEMPDITGLEACHLIKSRPELAHIPIIMVTQVVDPASLRDAFLAGAMDYVFKPPHPVQLAARVNSALNLKREMDRRKEREQHLEKMALDLSQTNQKLRELNLWLETEQETSPDGILALDAAGRLRRHNRRLLRLWGLTTRDFPPGDGRALLEIMAEHANDPAAFRELTLELLRQPDRELAGDETGLATGQVFTVHSKALTNPDRTSGGRIWFFRDISLRKDLENRLRTMAATDPLTAALNRRAFFEAAATEMERAARYGRDLAVIQLDVDHFKYLNDTLGHGAGDLALKGLCHCLRRFLREADLLGRLGGEEFAIILPETGLDQTREAAERLRRAVAGLELDWEGQSFGFTISLGVALCRPASEPLEQTLNRADQALYRAKENGRDRVEVSLD